MTVAELKQALSNLPNGAKTNVAEVKFEDGKAVLGPKKPASAKKKKGVSQDAEH